MQNYNAKFNASSKFPLHPCIVWSIGLYLGNCSEITISKFCHDSENRDEKRVNRMQITTFMSSVPIQRRFWNSLMDDHYHQNDGHSNFLLTSQIFCVHRQKLDKYENSQLPTLQCTQFSLFGIQWVPNLL